MENAAGVILIVNYEHHKNIWNLRVIPVLTGFAFVFKRIIVTRCSMWRELL